MHGRDVSIAALNASHLTIIRVQGALCQSAFGENGCVCLLTDPNN